MENERAMVGIVSWVVDLGNVGAFPTPEILMTIYRAILELSQSHMRNVNFA